MPKPTHVADVLKSVLPNLRSVADAPNDGYSDHETYKAVDSNGKVYTMKNPASSMVEFKSASGIRRQIRQDIMPPKGAVTTVIRTIPKPEPLAVSERRKKGEDGEGDGL